LWGAEGGNQSGLFAHLLDVLPYQKVALLGDIFDGVVYERETDADREVLSRIRNLDDDGRLHIVRGNHDRDFLRSPELVVDRARARAVGADATLPDVAWLTRSRLYDDVFYAETDRHVQVADGTRLQVHPRKCHTGSSDVLVLRVGSGLVYLEHGDRYDRVATRAHKNSILEQIGKGAYDMLVHMEKGHVGFGGLTATLKQKVSVWRGVCGAVARGACTSSRRLAHEVAATVTGHTHYPLYSDAEQIPHANAGSFRGYRPSFVIVTADTGEVLPPVVVQAGRI
jgi:predicted phosphodiesterase